MGKRLKDKVALVTGGSKGLGRTQSVRMAEEGAKVAVTDIADEAGAVWKWPVAAGFAPRYTHRLGYVRAICRRGSKDGTPEGRRKQFRVGARRVDRTGTNPAASRAAPERHR